MLEGSYKVFSKRCVFFYIKKKYYFYFLYFFFQKKTSVLLSFYFIMSVDLCVKSKKKENFTKNIKKGFVGFYTKS